MRAVLLLFMMLAAPAAARRATAEALPTGEIMLDLDRPVVEAMIAGVPMRLEVALDARDTVELNPDAAARLPLAFEPSGEIEVGRVTLRGRHARAPGIIAGRPVALVVETHERPCCPGVDGTIGPEQMPFARIRYVRGGGSPQPGRRYPATVTPEAGFAVAERVGGATITLKLAPAAGETIATGAAGAILARAGGGDWTGPKRQIPIAFGVARPVRPIRFARPPVLLGFPVADLLVRTVDFRGGRALPQDAALPSDITVRGRGRASQHEWRAVTLGRAQLDRCSEIVVERVPSPMLELHCGEAPR